jgi:hypothetical protein
MNLKRLKPELFQTLDSLDLRHNPKRKKAQKSAPEILHPPKTNPLDFFQVPALTLLSWHGLKSC